MDTIAFVDDGDSKAGVRIIINGRELIEIVREVELPFASKAGFPGIAGDYGYFGPAVTFLPARHFLGEPMHEWTDGPGRIYVLSCTCGIPGCWPLSASVELRENEVIWSDFRQPRRGPESPAGEWRYDKLGPFVFDRRAYEEELAKTPPPKRSPKPLSPGEMLMRRLTTVFNLGFRQGANDRAAAGLTPAPGLKPASTPPSSPECRDRVERKAWAEGYLAGYVCGASDAELASVDEPGAHGLVSGWSEAILGMTDFFQRLSNDDPSVP